MTKVLTKPNFIAQYGSLVRKIETLERSSILSSVLMEINTSGLSSEEIDKIVIGGPRGAPPNGKMISDPMNKLLLVRQENKWLKTKLE